MKSIIVRWSGVWILAWLIYRYRYLKHLFIQETIIIAKQKDVQDLCFPFLFSFFFLIFGVGGCFLSVLYANRCWTAQSNGMTNQLSFHFWRLFLPAVFTYTFGKRRSIKHSLKYVYWRLSRLTMVVTVVGGGASIIPIINDMYYLHKDRQFCLTIGSSRKKERKKERKRNWLKKRKNFF